MASQESFRRGDAVIFIVPHKIQRKRLEDMKISMKKKNIPLAESLGPNVTHVVTEFESVEQVEKVLKKEGWELPKTALLVVIKWLTECLKASKIIDVQQSHKLKRTEETESGDKEEDGNLTVPEWACQRVARLVHLNKKLTDAIEVLQEHAELRDGHQDYSRALAFRRASCVLKSLPFAVQDVRQLEGLKDVGGHVKRVLSDLLDNGSSSEVQEILNSSWYQKMKLFTSVFGIGPSTAKKWIDNELESIKDVKRNSVRSSDWRVIWGLAFFEDLNSPVLRSEADRFLSIVQQEAEKLLPGVIVQLCGGFRRGKSSGHDVDILLTHPKEGSELGLLHNLLLALEKKDLILIGHKEKSSFRQEILFQDFKLSMRGQLDHFEKWLGICKFPKSFQEQRLDSCLHNDDSNSNSNCLSDHAAQDLDSVKHCEHSEADTQTQTQGNSQLHKASQEKSSEGTVPTCHSLNESFDGTSYEPSAKKAKCGSSLDACPDDLADSERDWVARRVDLIIAPYSQYYYALVGWTGSKHFNRDARLYAQKVLGLKLTSHGLFDMAKKEALPSSSEAEVFHHLKLPYRDPEDRNC
ncbi:DNA-directed DNA/RNA polymerase mu isoform X2 [Aplysia californica]|uniref:DNA-directed DNA/RNA polymerase mu isoform X2 n=1 Tax=Aplysia californica TaxID=6500 RepID=A0ABM0JAD7_APLCA|nr:DNA-directed DNA/RNA polymerase mu isoform X2 [Aplysia californica]